MPTHTGSGQPREEVTQSERDWAFAKRALTRGDDPEEIIRRIFDYRGEEKHSNYARYTVEKAKAALHNKGNAGSPAEQASFTRESVDTLAERDALR